MAIRTRRRRAWYAALVALAVVWAATFGLLWSRRGDDGTNRRLTVRTIQPGTPGPPAALWLLGRATLRTDPRTLRHRQVLDVQAFGSVQGARGRLDLFDPGQGRLAMLDATRNQLVELGSVPVTPGLPAVEPVVADTDDALWIVTGPASVTRFDLATRTTAELTVPSDSPVLGAGAVTRVASDVRAVYTVTMLAAGGGTATRIDPATRAPTATAPVPDLDVVAMTVDSRGLWLIGRHGYARLDRESLRVAARRRYADASIDLLAGGVTRGAIWGLDRSSGALVEIGSTGRVRHSVPVRARGKLPLPADLVTGSDAVWAMVPVEGSARFGPERLTRVDPRTGRVTGGFVAPGALEIGALARSLPSTKVRPDAMR